MALFYASEHADNPPETWNVKKVSDRCWRLVAKDGRGLDDFTTKRAAEEARTSGFCFDLYEKEGRWYAEEAVDGWKPFTAEVRARQDAILQERDV